MNIRTATDAELQTNRLLHLQREIRGLRKQNEKLRAEIGRREVLAEQIASALASAEPLPSFKYKEIGKRATPVEIVLKLSDWHIGEIVRKDETEGFGEFNWQVAQARVYRIIENFLRWANLQRTVYSIGVCHLFLEGDYISGDIHEELKVTNEWPVPVQTANAGLLLAEVIRIACSHFKTVVVHCIGADNHGRLAKKPQAKQKTTNNMNYLVYAVMEARVHSLTNAQIIKARAAKHLATVNGWRFLIEHGDAIRGWAGLPWYGIERLFGKEAKRRMNTRYGFDYWSFGHFHTPMVIEWKTLINGSLSGTTEFDHQSGRHSKPGQMAFMIHRENGLMSPMVFWGDT